VLSTFFIVVSVFIAVSVLTVVASVIFISVDKLLPQDAKAPIANTNNNFFLCFVF
jgi:hypothetical protein